MTSPGWGSLLKRLADNELILPLFENQMLSERWPEKYQITIDSGPYYGHGDGYFHPSSHPLLGARLLYYMFHPDTRDHIVKERRNMQSLTTLSMGSALHGIVQTQMEMTGLVKPENIEVEYVNTEHHIRGRIDFIVDHPNGSTLPVEMKTINSFSFKKQTEIKPSWDAQLSIALDGIGIDRGVLLMVEAGWPYQMREFLVHRNDVLLEEIYTKFALVREAIKNNNPPQYCCSFDSDQMKKCPARFLCWLKEDDQV
jgi:hypothetical protein